MANRVKMAERASARKGRERKCFEEKQFAKDWAEGQLRQRDLAERYGLSLSMVKKITSGQRRPRIAEMIQAARREARDRCERRLTRLLETASWTPEAARRTLERVMMEGPPAAAVAAVREVLRLALDAPGSRARRRGRPRRGRPGRTAHGS